MRTKTNVVLTTTSARDVAKELHHAVSRIIRPGDYCTSGRVPLVLPGLEVSGLGPIGLPLTASQAQELKTFCAQAPYGKGEETLVDVSVRRVWHLKPDQFSLTNSDWSEWLLNVVARVQAGLGLKDQLLEAHLYDLLLYEEGSFFLPHRDGEKLDRMVATLILVLPSPFEGGELLVRHDGQEQTIAFGSDAGSCFQIEYAAFYADCEHEVRPLRKGHRLCLVYNLTLAKPDTHSQTPSKSKSRAVTKETAAKKLMSKKVTTKSAAVSEEAALTMPLTAPRLGDHIIEISRVLTAWSQDNRDQDKAEVDIVSQKLAVRLEHKYTKGGLTWDALKGTDRTKALTLAEAAAQSGCHAFLALLTFWESGSSEGDEDGYGYGRRGRSRSWDDEEWDDDDDDNDESGVSLKSADDTNDGGISGKYEMGEVYDESLSAEQLIGINGESFPVGALLLKEQEIVPPDSLRLVKPEEQHEGFTGNAGMTLERWYRHAVILLWPDRLHFDVLCSCGSREAALALPSLVARMNRANKAEAAVLRTQCVRFADRIMANWPKLDYVGPSYDSRNRKLTDESNVGMQLLKSLLALEEADLIVDFVTNVLARDASVNPGKLLATACKTVGWTRLRKPLEAIFASISEAALSRNIRLLEHLCTATVSDRSASKSQSKSASFKSKTKAVPVETNSTRYDCCRSLATRVINALVRLDSTKEKGSYYGNDINRTALLTELTRALIATDQHDLLSQVIEHTLAIPEKYPLITAHVVALNELAKWLQKHLTQPCAAVTNWIAAISSQLATRTTSEPQPPADFRRPATLKCSCADCKLVNTFLTNPSASTHRLRARQQIRDHVNNNIRNSECDLQTTTDTKGSPHTLVCTKTTASFERSLKTYHEDVKHLTSIRLLSESLSD
ncbi:MAG: 2OG-Fe(II) oxygenase [Planctomycetia bacterium]|nr:2OG-Fe(II) oxygenase [Planctomycetia bacterium]